MFQQNGRKMLKPLHTFNQIHYKFAATPIDKTNGNVAFISQ